jgi:hypothetical protein
MTFMALAAALLGAGTSSEAEAQDSGANFVAAVFNEIETKYIFGFTEGSGIGLQGEKEISLESIGRFGKRNGRFTATDTRLEYETTPTQFIQLEFSTFMATHRIKNVTDMDDRNSTAFNGLSAELRYLILEKRPGQPISATISIEPEWHRVDENGGERVKNFELETKLAVDVELVENRMFLGLNAVYEPEYNKTAMELEKESNLNFSAALVYRITPPLLLGAEVGYFRHYQGYALDHYEGYALFVGPTLYYQIDRKSFLTAAWATQVRGHAVGDPRALNLDEYSRQRGKLKYAYEF